MMRAIELRNTVIGFDGKDILPPLSASSERAEITTLLGCNGIGKSTLLKTIAALHSPISGSLVVDGRDIFSMTRRDITATISYVSTEPVKASNMRVSDLIAFGRYSHTNWIGRLLESDRRVIAESADKVGLSALLNRFVDEISDGERQRAMIARALAQDTPLMVMDEPTAFLDTRNSSEILNLMVSLARNEEKGLLMSTHDIQSAINYSDKIWLMTEGGIKEGGTEDMVADGSIGEMFRGSSVTFCPVEGSFRPSARGRGKMRFYLQGEGVEAIWAGKAIKRAGGILCDKAGEDADFRLTAGSGRDGKCLFSLDDGSNIVTFSSIYQMSQYLRSGNIIC